MTCAIRLFVVLWISVATPHVVGAAVYHLTDLGDLPSGSDGSGANAINSLGQVVGSSGTISADGQPRAHAFLWTKAGGMQDLGPAAGDESVASDINDAGQIAGTYFTNAQDGTPISQHAVVWTAPNSFQVLGHLPGDDSSGAAAINNHGQVAGDSRVYSAQGSIDHAVVWSSSGAIQYLGDIPGGTDVSFAQGINDQGQVAGTSGGSSSSRAFRWASEGGMQDLGGIPGGSGFSSAQGISNSGAVVGHGIAGQNASRASHAFLWRSDTGMQDLGDLPGGGTNSVALGLNSHDTVVGRSDSGSFPNANRAFIWTQAAGMKDLNTMLDSSDSGWTLYEARDINDAGQIVGYGRNASGALHAFLLTPVPEPSAAVLATLSVFGVAVLRRRIRQQVPVKKVE